MTFKQLLVHLRACEDARIWAGDKTIEEVVNECERADWLLWLAEKVECDRRKLVLCGGLCANTVRHLMNDERSIKAVDVAIAYGEGRATDDELSAARAAASDAAWASGRDAALAAALASALSAALAAARAAASDAARAAASDAALSAARAAASDAARAAASDAALSAARAAARAAAFKDMADIIRPVIKDELVEKVNELCNATA